MAFPHITIKTTNYELTDTAREVTEEKISALEKFLPKGETDLVCDVEIERDAKHHTGEVYRAEINFKVAGTVFRSEATGETVEDAVAEARNDMKRELRRSQSKRQSLMRRGGKKIKDLMRFGR